MSGPGPVVGYYVHHQGSGHLSRAGAVAHALGGGVTGLSSLARPSSWEGEWVGLDRDDRDDRGGPPTDPTAGGRLHYVPAGDPGLRARTAQVSAWIERARPDVLVSDVSVEIALLARLHGVPVVSVVLPGERGDAPHRLGHDVSAALVAVWPAAADGMVTGLCADSLARLHRLGGLSRFPVRPDDLVRRPGPRRVTVLLGDGGGLVPPGALDRAARETPDWEWTVLGRAAGTWTDDPFDVLCHSDVVVTHAGQNALAEVAAARRPAVVVPAARPHDEQSTTGAVLRSGPWPARVETGFPEEGWAARLDEVASYDGAGWAGWTDGLAADRFADVLREVARPGTRRRAS